ncbi:MAG: 6-phosphogluconolactonase [Ardenticatenaceae bacterium]|nr:6-phosphogluconolactonase [Ardenticatenaceae bacterium]
MTLIVFNTRDELADAAAEMVVGLLEEAVHKRGEGHLALSGGGTPRPVYKRWAQPPLSDAIPWAKIHIWWADERCVPASDPESNYRLAAEAFLDRLPIPTDHIHRMPGELSPENGAVAYAAELKKFADPHELWPRFDACILGMGTDGHTASLFPGSINAGEVTRPTLGVSADYDGRPAERITLTPLVINAARTAIVLATGAGKASMLAQVLGSDDDPVQRPIERIRPLDGEIIWFLDRAAAGNLE